MKQITIKLSDRAYENMRLMANVINMPAWSDKKSTPEKVLEAFFVNDKNLESWLNVSHTVISHIDCGASSEDENKKRKKDLAFFASSFNGPEMIYL
jgi:hypothetical protein